MKYRNICLAMDTMGIDYRIHDTRVLNEDYDKEGHDLDLSLRAFSFFEVKNKLHALADVVGMRIVNILWHSKNAASFFLYDKASLVIYHLDIHWGSFYFELESILSSDELFKSVRIIDDLSFVGQEEMACIRFVKDVRKKRITPEEQRKFLSGFDDGISCLYNDRFVSIVQGNRRIKIFSKLDVIVDESRRICHRILRPNGLTVAFLGPDGSGKSSVIQGLIEHSHLPYRRVLYFHLWPKRSKESKVNTDPHLNSQRGVLVSFMKLLKYWLIYSYGYCRYIVVAKRSSSLIIFDRFAHDIFIDPKRFGLSLPDWVLKGFVRVISDQTLYAS